MTGFDTRVIIFHVERNTEKMTGKEKVMQNMMKLCRNYERLQLLPEMTGTGLFFVRSFADKLSESETHGRLRKQ